MLYKIVKQMAIILFDVDGTLTIPRQKISQNMRELIRHLRNNHYVGLVSGSDLVKIKEQLGESINDDFDYIFVENGLVAYKNSTLIGCQSIQNLLSEDQIKKFINYCLKYLSELDIPVKRGTFIEFRRGMINISPIGRNCSQKERDDFEKYDHKHNVRKSMIEILKKEFAELNLSYSIGGQISFDVYPKGWDKSYCLQYLDKPGDIYFFGDQTQIGGNDHELYIHQSVKGYAVKNPEETQKILINLFGK